MRQLALLLLVLAGCNRDVDHEAIAGPAAPAAAPIAAAHAIGLPHSANIREVAVAEQGDAAVSVDQLGRLRLWTALDGSQEPVEISAPAPTQLAVASTAFEVVIGVLDETGSAHVLRAGRDGVMRGRAQVGGDVAITQIAALGDHLLVLRADQSIEELDGGGVVRSRIAADPGERISALAVRAGGVLAVLANPDGTASTLRWVEHASGLAWGMRVALPAAVTPESVALSPSHHLIGAAEAKSHQLFVYDITTQPALARVTDVQLQPGEAVGFPDDQDVAGLSPVSWKVLDAKPADPWAPTTPPSAVPAASLAAGAVANGVVVSGLGPSLALITSHGTRYLGYAEMDVTTATLVGDRIAIATSGRHFAWLDRSLVEQHAIDLPDQNAYGLPLDDRHVLTERGLPKGGLEVGFVDIDHVDHTIALGSFDSVSRLEVEPHSQVLFVFDGVTLHRYRLDLADDTFTALPNVKLDDGGYFRALDPDVADGAFAAVTTSLGDNTTRLDVLRDEGGKVVRKKLRSVPAFIAAMDDHADVWWRERGDGPIHHGDVTLPAASAVVIDHASNNVLQFDGTTLALYGRDGKLRWQVPAWRAYSYDFTADDRAILVRGLGGLMMIDAATGERIATACGWRFGIYDKPLEASASGVESVCEDSGR